MNHACLFSAFNRVGKLSLNVSLETDTLPINNEPEMDREIAYRVSIYKKNNLSEETSARKSD